MRSFNRLVVVLLLGLSACGPLATSEPALETAPEVTDSGSEGTQEAEEPELAAVEPDEPADLIFHNGTLLTMDPAMPEAQAIAIRGDTIQAVGDDQTILALAGPETRVVDLQGRTLLPGFNDPHSHWIGDRGMQGWDSPDEAIDAALANGFTSITELFVNQGRLDELTALGNEGRLRLRVNAWLPLNYTDDKFGSWYLAYEPHSTPAPNLRLGGLKIFIDHDWGYNFHWTQAELDAAIQEAHDNGWQVTAHSVSEEAQDLMLNAYDKVLAGESNENYRYRIDHLMQVRDDQVERMRDLGIIASIHLMGSTDWPIDPVYLEHLGDHPEWLARQSDFVDAGLMMVAGMDVPWVYIPNQYEQNAPMRSLYEAETRVGIHITSPEDWQAAQTITVEQALPMMTINPAYAAFQEDVLGSLTPGKWADITILSDNPLEVSKLGLLNIDIMLTMVGGQAQYCTPDFADLCNLPASSGGDAAPSLSAEDIVIPSDGALRIAVLAPGSGQLSQFLPAMEQAARLAIEDYGGVAGFPVEVWTFDDGCDTGQGASAAQSVVDDGGLLGVIGPACTTSANGGLPVLQQAGIVTITASATAPGLGLQAPDIFNRTLLDDNAIAAQGRTHAYVNDLPQVQALYARIDPLVPGLLPDLRPLVAYGYDATMILLTSLTDVAQPGDNGSLVINRTALADAVRATQNFAGITGAISFDAQGDRTPGE